MKRYPHIVAGVFSEPWAVVPSKLEAIAHVLECKLNGEALEYQAQARPAERAPHAPGVGVLPIRGVLAQRMNLMSEFSGGTSTQMLSQQLHELVNDTDVASIVLDVDSPGGSVYGIAELGDEIFEARRKKRIVAIANSMAASAAYWLASQAHELVITPGGEAGSIGVVAVHVDRSGQNELLGVKPTYVTAGRYKAEGNFDQSLGDEARRHVQSRVDEYYSMFAQAVARGRGVTTHDVRRGFGEGRVLGAQAAVREGLADRIATLGQVVFDSRKRRRV
jgi:signal peptide peptidase SppA